VKNIKIKNLLVFERKGVPLEMPPHPSTCILKGINLEIDIAKENICIMGESGSGKSTLLNVISGSLSTKLVPSKNSIIIPPGIRFFTLFQDADLYLSSHNSLYYYLKLAFAHNGWDAGLVNELVKELQVSITLPPKKEKKLSPGTINYWKNLTKVNLSGGNKQKFMILLGLIVNPGVMLLDEIFTDIDDRSKENIIAKIFTGERRIIMVSHDYVLVKRLLEERKIDKVYNLSDGNLDHNCWKRSSKDITWVEDMEQNHREIEKIILNKKIAKVPGANTYRYKLDKIVHAYGKSKVIDQKDAPPLTLLTSCNYAITGENGVGKSTLVKILMKLEPYKGSISYCSLNGSTTGELAKLNRAKYMEDHQLVFQKTGNSLQTDRPLKEFLLSYFKTQDREEKWKEVEEYCRIFCLSPGLISNRTFSQLSVGQQRRLMLIRALLLLKENGCLFIDEAMRGMDISLKRRLVEHLKDKPYQVFLISHDEQLRKALCEKELNIKNINGCTYFDVDEVMSNKV
jgi:ABC-type glutathione transport system ATPase component